MRASAFRYDIVVDPVGKCITQRFSGVGNLAWVVGNSVKELSTIKSSYPCPLLSYALIHRVVIFPCQKRASVIYYIHQAKKGVQDMRTDAQKDADRKYRAQNQKIIRFSLNRKTDAEIIKFWESQENKLSLFKKLTRDFMGNPQTLTGADAPKL